MYQAFSFSTHRTAIGEAPQEKIKCGVNHSQIRSQSTFIRLTPDFTVLDIWKGFATNYKLEIKSLPPTYRR